jgi:endonuclease G
MPQLTRNFDFSPSGGDLDVPGVSVLVREGFVVVHHDRFKVPMWVSMRWTDEDLQESENLSSLPRPFNQDFELPWYARSEDRYPGHTTHQQDRGHMARHADNRAYGRDNSDAGCLMSNIVPQQAGLNQGIWNDLEDEHRNVVGLSSLGVDQLWVISGPIFADHTPEFTVANDVGVPGAFYKVIGWFRDGEFQARGYVLERFDDEDDLASYLTPIDQIEQATGIDFFPDMEDVEENALESATFSTLWGQLTP